MKVTRIYSDDQGETHFADHDVELHDRGPIGFLSDPIAATSVIFRTNGPAYNYDWHVDPQRQFIALLDGAIEIEVSDGSRRSFRAGEILLVEDTTGKGHKSRNIEPSERRSIFIVLDDHGAP
jgi:hypothetical protein